MTDTAREMQKKEAGTPETGERTRATRIYAPQVDIIERKNDIMVIADMPGVDETSVDITLEKNILTIYGRVDVETPQDHRLSLSEYGIGDYQRVFTLSDEVDRDKIQATVKNGVLSLVMPKAESARTRKIPIKAEGVGGALNLG
ncbi:MAG TPA: Hsp20/alpha crystallin family protein [Thermodesulfovibrionales bacterium]|jgi:HSP20 family molecular chaperone IbpA|nr:Hsp20/alpha crystallin family protein [Thermodesulfovibrionales bacterium]